MSVGGKEVSGTTMRNILGSPKLDDKTRPKVFKKLFGYYDKGVYQMMANKFKKLFEFYNSQNNFNHGHWEIILMQRFLMMRDCMISLIHSRIINEYPLNTQK